MGEGPPERSWWSRPPRQHRPADASSPREAYDAAPVDGPPVDRPPAAGPTAPAAGDPSPGAAAGTAAGADRNGPSLPTEPGPPPGAHPAAEAGPAPWGQYDPWAAPRATYHQADAPHPRRRGRVGTLLGALALALVAGLVGGGVGAYVERNGVGDVVLPQVAAEDADRAPDSVAGIAASALPSVVTLHVEGANEQGTGTGFVLDRQGHILTNNHVVEPAAPDGTVTVTFSGGESARAELVGRDAGYDLAVVRVEGVGGLRPLPLGNSDDVRVGDPVVAIGAPFDLPNTVTSGIISAKERPITAGGDKGDGSDVAYVDALQTDAPINPGNSGGPLVDARGRVVGINSAIRSAGEGTAIGGQAGSIGLGFAIPINQGRRVAEELINTGRATHPVIEVTLDMQYTGDGARVAAEDNSGGPAVRPGGPGDRAGVRARDVITAVGGARVHSGEELIVRIRSHRPGDRLELTVRRGGAERTLTLTLGSASSG
ncbi:S1C family serine protease [Streptomyces sp. NPDC060194]|uniref:S1C family serine protease n=1 Tax=Streptomyces sp. NPDC060194 TaxID=3347069 RepID=UPI00364E33C3